MIHAPRGRGPQLNAGWRHSSSPWCLFLHADSQLAPGFCNMFTTRLKQQQQQQQEQMQSKKLAPALWGCFSTIEPTGVSCGLSPGLRTKLNTAMKLFLRTLLLRMRSFHRWIYLMVRDSVAVVHKAVLGCMVCHGCFLFGMLGKLRSSRKS